MKRRIVGFIVALVSLSQLALAFPNGVSGYTLKTNSAGCGSCHNGPQSASVLFRVPTTLQINQVARCTVLVAGSNTGVDIALSGGSFAPIVRLKTLNSDLTHPSRGSGTYVFDFTAPPTPGDVTLYATGLSNGKDGPWNHAQNATISVVSITSVHTEVPATFSLNQNFPNPFNPATTISYSIPEAGRVTLTVFDAGGRLVARLVDDVQQPGEHRVRFSGESLASGIYFCRLAAGGRVALRKLLLTK